MLISITLLLSCQTSKGYARKADYYYSRADYISAIDFYQKAQNTKQRDRYQFNLAMSYSEIGQYSVAIYLLTQLMESQSGNHLVKQSLAYCYSKNGDVNEALILYDELLAANKMDSNALRGRALVLWQTNQSTQALKELKAYYHLAPDALIKKSIATIYFLDKNDAMALKWLDNNPDQLENLKSSIDYSTYFKLK